MGQRYPFFYNPMWSFLGDRNGTAPGTYHLSASEDVCYFWNAFDQVLIRPELMQRLGPDSVQVVSTVGDVSLLDAVGKPDRSQYSDHLPVLLRLD